MRSKRELLLAAYQAFNARDIEAVLAMMHPDVDWPDGMEGGRLSGPENVRKYWTRQWNMMNPRVEPVGIVDDQAGRTVVRVHQVVRDLVGNIVIDQFVEHVYTIREGLLARMDVREADPQQAAAATDGFAW
jgi:hypothetical protein